jgi:hypothetical protein
MFNCTQNVDLQIVKKFTKFQTLRAEATRLKDLHTDVNETFLELPHKFLGEILRIINI